MTQSALEDSNFNVERRRYYGLRKGDLCKRWLTRNPLDYKGRLFEVVEYGFMDNNSVFIKEYGVDEKPYEEVAEYLKPQVKVEDRLMEHQQVKLLFDAPWAEISLKQDEVGTLVHIYKKYNAFEVEFVRLGKSYVVTFPVNFLERVN